MNDKDHAEVRTFAIDMMKLGGMPASAAEAIVDAIDKMERACETPVDYVGAVMTALSISLSSKVFELEVAARMNRSRR